MSLFLKQQLSADAARKEASGLQLLRKACADTGIDVPTVVSVEASRLTLERIDTVAFSEQQWIRLGQGLARLHARQPACITEASSPAADESIRAGFREGQFGLAEDNYIGLNPQPNGWWPQWGEFFVTQRLGYQIDLVRHSGRRHQLRQRLASVRERLVAFLDAECEGPRLVHGDLWHGNVLADRDGRVWLIDPAVYYGDREADLAMTELFGGFAPAFYWAYDELLPRTRAYSRKRAIYNLYHNLNHFNLFGASYWVASEAGWAAIEAL